jgi:hypothetical protein
MMSLPKYFPAAACLAFLSLGLATSGCASPSAEEWKTAIQCGGVQYVVTSHCKSSGDLFELNTCQPKQQLASGLQYVEIPSKQRSMNQAPLFATHWQCVRTDTGSYLMLDFSTGTGRAASDEAVEFYDSHLRKVSDEAIIHNIYKHTDKASEGYVKSIYPGEGN